MFHVKHVYGLNKCLHASVDEEVSEVSNVTIEELIVLMFHVKHVYGLNKCLHVSVDEEASVLSIATIQELNV